jgi:hypothetical protein
LLISAAPRKEALMTRHLTVIAVIVGLVSASAVFVESSRMAQAGTPEAVVVPVSSDVTTCPADSLFSQTEFTVVVAGSDYGSDWKRYENVWGLGQPVCGVHWWGEGADDQLAACIKDPDQFEITFYVDEAGEPGAVACGPYLVTPEKVSAGSPGWVYYYRAVVAPCCELASGWVSIVGLDHGQNCHFWWRCAESDGVSWAEDLDGGSRSQSTLDLSLCLPPRPDCPCGDVDASGGSVDLSDFNAFAVCFDLTNPQADCSAEMFLCSDLDDSGKVDLTDFSTFAILFGQTSTETIPDCLGP